MRTTQLRIASVVLTILASALPRQGYAQPHTLEAPITIGNGDKSRMDIVAVAQGESYLAAWFNGTALHLRSIGGDRRSLGALQTVELSGSGQYIQLLALTADRIAALLRVDDHTAILIVDPSGAAISAPVTLSGSILYIPVGAALSNSRFVVAVTTTSNVPAVSVFNDDGSLDAGPFELTSHTAWVAVLHAIYRGYEQRRDRGRLGSLSRFSRPRVSAAELCFLTEHFLRRSSRSLAAPDISTTSCASRTMSCGVPMRLQTPRVGCNASTPMAHSSVHRSPVSVYGSAGDEPLRAAFRRCGSRRDQRVSLGDLRAAICDRRHRARAVLCGDR